MVRVLRGCGRGKGLVSMWHRFWTMRGRSGRDFSPQRTIHVRQMSSERTICHVDTCAATRNRSRARKYLAHRLEDIDPSNILFTIILYIIIIRYFLLCTIILLEPVNKYRDIYISNNIVHNNIIITYIYIFNIVKQ